LTPLAIHWQTTHRAAAVAQDTNVIEGTVQSIFAARELGAGFARNADGVDGKSRAARRQSPVFAILFCLFRQMTHGQDNGDHRELQQSQSGD